MKLKQIQEIAEVLPESAFEEPNFISLKTATSRTESLIETLVQSHDYARCDELQKLIAHSQECLRNYCANPQPSILQEMEASVIEMKKLTI